jgi:hypothetical protein
MGEWKGTTRAWNLRLKRSGFSVHTRGDRHRLPGTAAAADSVSVGGPARGNETNAKRLSRRKGIDKFHSAQ